VKGLLLRGKPISPGYYGQGDGLWGRREPEFHRRPIPAVEVEDEVKRFRQARENSRTELRRLSERVKPEIGSVESETFSAHLLLLEDPQFVGRVEEAVRNDLMCIESALDDTVEELVPILRKWTTSIFESGRMT
jgi:phosphoenolpyruvate-protein kinase (PTS system EI component)